MTDTPKPNSDALWAYFLQSLDIQDACEERYFSLRAHKRKATEEDSPAFRASLSDAKRQARLAERAAHKALRAYERACLAEVRALFLNERFTELGISDRRQREDLARRLVAVVETLEEDGVSGVPGARSLNQLLYDLREAENVGNPERLKELAEERRRAKATAERMEEAERTNPLVAEAVRQLWALVPSPKPESLPFRDFFFGDFDIPIADGPPLDRASYRFVLAMAWPEVLASWHADNQPRVGPSFYRYPLEAVNYNKALAGKRHGKAAGLAVRTKTQDSGAMRLVVSLPRGAQLELGCRGLEARAKSDAGPIAPETVLRLIREVTGAGVAIMGHAAFALAFAQAEAEGRQPDGRFWFSPTEVGDLLGYKRESNGTASRTRISREATAKIRSNFHSYADVLVEQTHLLPDGTEIRVKGSLLYPTKKEEAVRQPGQRGRDARVEWRIRDELWALMKRRHVQIPLALLNSETERPDVWAEAVRVYEVIAGHGRNNPEAAAAGALPAVSVDWLVEECNLASAGTRPDLAAKKLIGNLDKLAARGALTYQRAALKDGRPALSVTLPEARRNELAEVAARRQPRALPAKAKSTRKPAAK